MPVTRAEFITGLKRQFGVSEEAAAARWDALSESTRAPTRIELPPEDEHALEKTTQIGVRNLFLAFGARVYWLSQSRVTKQTPGLPDLFVFFPTRGIALWWETKRPKGGHLSGAQVEFRDLCALCDVRHGAGPRADAEAWLIEHGFAERHGDALEPLRDAA